MSEPNDHELYRLDKLRAASQIATIYDQAGYSPETARFVAKRYMSDDIEERYANDKTIEPHRKSPVRDVLPTRQRSPQSCVADSRGTNGHRNRRTAKAGDHRGNGANAGAA